MDIRRGAIGENLVYELLKSGESCIDVIDVRSYDYFRGIDVDFLQIKSDGEPVKIEVKTDLQAHNTGNIAYEYVSSCNIKTIGCFEKTKSDYIFYYLMKSGQLYLFNTPQLRAYVEKNKEEWRLVRMGDDAKGYLLPISKLVAENICSLL